MWGDWGGAGKVACGVTGGRMSRCRVIGEVQEWRWGDWGGAAGVAVGGWGGGGEGAWGGGGNYGEKAEGGGRCL